MKILKIFLLVLICLIGVLFTFYLVIKITFGDVAGIPDEIMAHTITHYPSATTWRIHASGGILSPRGQPSTVGFDYNGTAEEVYKFYKTDLKKNGWGVIGSTDADIDLEQNGPPNEYAIFAGRSFLGMEFNLSLSLQHDAKSAVIFIKH